MATAAAAAAAAAAVLASHLVLRACMIVHIHVHATALLTASDILKPRTRAHPRLPERTNRPWKEIIGETGVTCDCGRRHDLGLSLILRRERVIKKPIKGVTTDTATATATATDTATATLSADIVADVKLVIVEDLEGRFTRRLGQHARQGPLKGGPKLDTPRKGLTPKTATSARVPTPTWVWHSTCARVWRRACVCVFVWLQGGGRR